MHREAQIKPQESIKNSKFKSLSCRFCNLTNIIKRGKRRTKNRGLIQRYYCKSCKKRFTQNNGFFRMRNSPEKITFCLDAYFRGMSLRKLQENLQVFSPHNSHYSTILRWIQKYCTRIGNYTDSLKINTSKHIQVDEMEFKTKGKISWFIDVIDPNTRFMVTSKYYDKRDKKAIREILKVVKNKDNEIRSVTTDGFYGYPKQIKKTFNTYKKKINHIRVNASRGEGFNHKIERLHNSIRERTKIMRHFNSLESARAIMKGYEIFYNFCRKHQAIKCYPYELATNLKLGKNKWLELIKLS